MEQAAVETVFLCMVVAGVGPLNLSRRLSTNGRRLLALAHETVLEDFVRLAEAGSGKKKTKTKQTSFLLAGWSLGHGRRRRSAFRTAAVGHQATGSRATARVVRPARGVAALEPADLTHPGGRDFAPRKKVYRPTCLREGYQKESFGLPLDPGTML